MGKMKFGGNKATMGPNELSKMALPGTPEPKVIEKVIEVEKPVYIEKPAEIIEKVITEAVDLEPIKQKLDQIIAEVDMEKAARKEMLKHYHDRTNEGIKTLKTDLSQKLQVLSKSKKKLEDEVSALRSELNNANKQLDIKSKDLTAYIEKTINAGQKTEEALANFKTIAYMGMALLALATVASFII